MSCVLEGKNGLISGKCIACNKWPFRIRGADVNMSAVAGCKPSVSENPRKIMNEHSADLPQIKCLSQRNLIQWPVLKAAAGF